MAVQKYGRTLWEGSQLVRSEGVRGMDSDVVDRSAFYIDGEWRAPTSGQTTEVVNPATEAVIGRVGLCANDDIDAAVEAAHRSFEQGEWRRSPVGERINVIRKAAEILESNREALLELIIAELGCPRRFAETVQLPVRHNTLRNVADEAERFVWEEVRSDEVGRSRVLHHPVGVVGAITPWNGPLTNPAIKIAPAIAAGCSVVVKAAPVTPLTGFVLVEALIEAGVPAGVVNYLPGDRDAGRYLVSHPDIDKVAFTGSTGAGKSIMAACADRVARVTLELGGKSAAILLDDYDPEEYARSVIPLGLTRNNGQNCAAQTRLVVPESRRRDVEVALVEVVAKLRIGDPSDPDVDIGPLVSRVQRDRVEEYIAVGKAEGARVATGGSRPSGFDRGWYIEPTVFVDVENGMRIAQEEIFGPVVVVIAYKDDADAIRIANDSIYGISGSVWTTDMARGEGVARALRTGSVSINGRPHAVSTPHGGFKQSGLGREFGPEGVRSYTETQRIAL
jgi:aldehyde dehydrogenase (NAD+)